MSHGFTDKFNIDAGIDLPHQVVFGNPFEE